MSAPIPISSTTQRRYILGQQGLWPGRRWRGKSGLIEASRAGAVIQIDPISVVTRSHDTSLFGRVLDYGPKMLDEAIYSDRALFDWGGTVFVYPMAELPYFRTAMARKILTPRWVAFAHENIDVIEHVLKEIRENGPHGSREFAETGRERSRWRSGKATSLAMYYLWLGGELMSHSRRNFDRMYDLRGRVAPPELDYAASEDEAEEHFMLTPFRELGIVTVKSWRGSHGGAIERKVDAQEAAARLERLADEGRAARVTLEGDAKTARYVLAGDLPKLATIEAGGVPAEWTPLDTTTEQEMTILAPLEVVSARGRAGELFDFEYLWEVYKPAEKRRWGYYVMPILYGDRLVARIDAKLERATGTLIVKGFWLEDGVPVDEAFVAALTAGLKRYMGFAGAERIDLGGVGDAGLRQALRARTG